MSTTCEPRRDTRVVVLGLASKTNADKYRSFKETPKRARERSKKPGWAAFWILDPSFPGQVAVEHYNPTVYDIDVSLLKHLSHTQALAMAREFSFEKEETYCGRTGESERNQFVQVRSVWFNRNLFEEKQFQDIVEATEESEAEELLPLRLQQKLPGATTTEDPATKKLRLESEVRELQEREAAAKKLADVGLDLPTVVLDQLAENIEDKQQEIEDVEMQDVEPEPSPHMPEPGPVMGIPITGDNRVPQLSSDAEVLHANPPEDPRLDLLAMPRYTHEKLDLGRLFNKDFEFTGPFVQPEKLAPYDPLIAHMFYEHRVPDDVGNKVNECLDNLIAMLNKVPEILKPKSPKHYLPESSHALSMRFPAEIEIGRKITDKLLNTAGYHYENMRKQYTKELSEVLGMKFPFDKMKLPSMMFCSGFIDHCIGFRYNTEDGLWCVANLGSGSLPYNPPSLMVFPCQFFKTKPDRVAFAEQFIDTLLLIARGANPRASSALPVIKDKHEFNTLLNITLPDRVTGVFSSLATDKDESILHTFADTMLKVGNQVVVRGQVAGTCTYSSPLWLMLGTILQKSKSVKEAQLFESSLQEAAIESIAFESRRPLDSQTGLRLVSHARPDKFQPWFLESLRLFESSVPMVDARTWGLLSNNILSRDMLEFRPPEESFAARQLASSIAKVMTRPTSNPLYPHVLEALTLIKYRMQRQSWKSSLWLHVATALSRSLTHYVDEHRATKQKPTLEQLCDVAIAVGYLSAIRVYVPSHVQTTRVQATFTRLATFAFEINERLSAGESLPRKKSSRGVKTVIPSFDDCELNTYIELYEEHVPLQAPEYYAEKKAPKQRDISGRFHRHLAENVWNADPRLQAGFQGFAKDAARLAIVTVLLACRAGRPGLSRILPERLFYLTSTELQLGMWIPEHWGEIDLESSHLESQQALSATEKLNAGVPLSDPFLMTKPQQALYPVLDVWQRIGCNSKEPGVVGMDFRFPRGFREKRARMFAEVWSRQVSLEGVRPERIFFVLSCWLRFVPEKSPARVAISQSCLDALQLLSENKDPELLFPQEKHAQDRRTMLIAGLKATATYFRPGAFHWEELYQEEKLSLKIIELESFDTSREADALTYLDAIGYVIERDETLEELFAMDLQEADPRVSVFRSQQLPQSLLLDKSWVDPVSGERFFVREEEQKLSVRKGSFRITTAEGFSLINMSGPAKPSVWKNLWENYNLRVRFYSSENALWGRFLDVPVRVTVGDPKASVEIQVGDDKFRFVEFANVPWFVNPWLLFRGMLSICLEQRGALWILLVWGQTELHNDLKRFGKKCVVFTKPGYELFELDALGLMPRNMSRKQALVLLTFAALSGNDFIVGRLSPVLANNMGTDDPGVLADDALPPGVPEFVAQVWRTEFGAEPSSVRLSLYSYLQRVSGQVGGQSLWRTVKVPITAQKQPEIVFPGDVNASLASVSIDSDKDVEVYKLQQEIIVGMAGAVPRAGLYGRLEEQRAKYWNLLHSGISDNEDAMPLFHLFATRQRLVYVRILVFLDEAIRFLNDNGPFPQSRDLLEPLGLAEVLFLAATGKTVRDEQRSLIAQMRDGLRTGSSAVFQAIMGLGKTSVVLPMLLLHEACTANPKATIVVQKASLIAQTERVLDAVFPFWSAWPVHRLLAKHFSTIIAESLQGLMFVSDSAFKEFVLRLAVHGGGLGVLDQVQLVFDEFDSVYNPRSSQLNIPDLTTQQAHPRLKTLANLREYYEALSSPPFVPYAPDLRGPFAWISEKLKHDRVTAQDLRMNVEFGADQEGKTLLAIPYEGFNTPAPGASFSDPDLVGLLTARLKYEAGLTVRDLNLFREVIGPSLEGLSPETAHQFLAALGFRNKKDYATRSKPLLDQPQAVRFYLRRVLLPTKLRSYSKQENISFLDLLQVTDHRVGMSGTLAIHDLQTDFGVRLVPSVPVGQLPGSTAEDDTTFKTRQAFRHVQYANSVKDPADLEDEILNMTAQGYDALIDSVAALRKLTSASVALRLHELTQRAVAFVEPNGEVRILVSPGDIQTWSRPQPGPLVYFDEQHSIGTDLPLSKTAVGLLVVSWKESKFSSTAQAAYRLRLLGKGQRLDLFFVDPMPADATSFWATLHKNEAKFMRSIKLLHLIQTIKAVGRKLQMFDRELFTERTPYQASGLLPPIFKKLISEPRIMELVEEAKRELARDPDASSLATSVEKESETARETSQERRSFKPCMNYDFVSYRVELPLSDYFNLESEFYAKLRHSGTKTRMQTFAAMTALGIFWSPGYVWLTQTGPRVLVERRATNTMPFREVFCLQKPSFGSLLVTSAEWLSLSVERDKSGGLGPDSFTAFSLDGQPADARPRPDMLPEQNTLCALLLAGGQLTVPDQLRAMGYLIDSKRFDAYRALSSCLHAVGVSLNPSNLVARDALGGSQSGSDVRLFLAEFKDVALRDENALAERLLGISVGLSGKALSSFRGMLERLRETLKHVSSERHLSSKTREEEARLSDSEEMLNLEIGKEKF